MALFVLGVRRRGGKPQPARTQADQQADRPADQQAEQQPAPAGR